MDRIDETGLEELCNAIVLQACKDLRIAYRCNDKTEIMALERFFYNGSFEQLTRYKIEPEYVVKKLQEQAADKNYKENYSRWTNGNS